MDFKRFFRTLKRNIWSLISVPVLAGGLTYYLVQDLPQEYKSQALISTGLSDQVTVDDAPSNYMVQNQRFNNIIESLFMKKNLNSLSYKLILHDLENPENAFHELPEELRLLDSNKRSAIVEEYKRFLTEEKVLTPDDNQEYALFDYIQLAGYGEEAIQDQLVIERKDNSDFIQIEYLSDNPYLSVYVVNTMANDFINGFKDRADRSKHNSKELLDSLLKNKEASMNAKNSQVKDFQVQNSTINVVSQAESLYGQIAEKEAQRATIVGEIQSLQGGIQGIEDKLKNRNSGLVSVSIEENNQIISLKKQLEVANERYVDNGFKPADARAIDSIQSKLTSLIASSASSTATDPRVLRQSLIQQKLDMEVELDRAKSGLSVILADLSRMKGMYNSMVPKDAGMKNYEREAEVATKEYLSALELYNKNNVLASTGVRPQLAQAGVVNPPEPSMKLIFVALAAFASLCVCLFILIIAFLLDNKIRSSEQLTHLTKQRILGVINRIVPNDKDLSTIWEEGNVSKDYATYKDLLRSLRFEIDEAMRLENKQILGVTGLFESSGSSFITSSLAFSFAKTQKKVLLIGGDYALDKTPEIKEIGDSQLFDSYIVKRELNAEKFITKLTTNSKNESLLEVYNEDVLRKGFDQLKAEFDVILVDIDSLQKVHRTKEWLMFVDKSIAVFPAGETVGAYEKDLISFMNQQENFMGWVLNKAKVEDIGLRKLMHAN